MAITKTLQPDRTSDINLAAALLSMGIPPSPGEEETFMQTDQGPRTFWNFLPGSIDGTEKTDPLIAGWEMEQAATREEDTFHAKNPLHPFSYIMAYEQNKKMLRKRVINAVPMFVLQRGPSVALIDPSSPQRIQDHLLGKIGA